MNLKNKKVLIISNDPLSSVGSNGKTFLSLFKSFQDSDVCQLYFERAIPYTTEFTNFYKFTDLDAFKRLFLRKQIMGDVKNEAVYKVIPQKNSRIPLSLSFIKWVRNFLYSTVQTNKIATLNAWLERNRPDVIFFVGSGFLYSYKILESVQRYLNIPFYVYFTDDYFKYNTGNNFVGRAFHKRFITKAVRIVAAAEELFVISPKMKIEYSSYFGKECSILINAVETVNSSVNLPAIDKPIIFSYFGWLHSSRSSSIGYLGKCLQYLNDNHQLNCVLNVFSLSVLTDESEKDLAVDTVRVQQPVFGSDYTGAINQSNFLIHAESFKPQDTRVTMLSVSTKIPEYLLSNRCVIAVGPPELASISLLNENELALVISEKRSIEEDANEILKLIYNKGIYANFTERGIAFCQKTFNATKMREALTTKLLSE